MKKASSCICSSFFTYCSFPFQTKGKAEEAVKSLSFDRTSIYRPGLLICERQETRRAEGLLQCVVKAVDRSSGMSIRTGDLGRAMVRNGLDAQRPKGAQTLEHHDIVKVMNRDDKK